MTYLVVATEAELELPWAMAYETLPRIITGVGGTNVIRALKNLPSDTEIINVGYCGSACYPVGSAHHIGDCRLWHPGVTFDEPSFRLSELSKTICFTAGDFVEGDVDLPGKAVVDMELAYICAFGFKVRAIKYVSDNLSQEDYKKNTIWQGKITSSR